MKILYVEDDEKVREELVSILNRRCSRVVLAADGTEGIVAYEKMRPDIIVADLLMPNMTGSEMIEKIRRENAKDIFSVVVLTALSDRETMISAVNAGIDKYIMKPVDVEELLRTLEEQAKIIYEHKYELDVDSGENPRVYEDEIKREFATLLKNYSGKGPKNVSVSIGKSTITILASEVMTTMEKTIVERSGNSGAVRYFREIFFYSLEDEFRQLIDEILHKKYQLGKAVISTDKDKVKLTFNEIRN
ncbi:MAG: response regulator [Bacillota bacterium]|nr:response regulator [Bacillota bacterium]